MPIQLTFSGFRSERFVSSGGKFHHLLLLVIVAALKLVVWVQLVVEVAAGNLEGLEGAVAEVWNPHAAVVVGDSWHVAGAVVEVLHKNDLI